MSADKFTVIAPMKNEAPYILEWVAHYKALGFDYIVVCTNDCEDTTRDILRRLQKLGVVYHHDTVPEGRRIHGPAIRQGRTLNRFVRNSRWRFICDADEFLNIHLGDGSVQDLVAHSGEGFDCICVPWRCFNSSRIQHIADHLVADQFRMAEVLDQPKLNPKPGKFVKSLSQNSPRIKAIGIHMPKFKAIEDPNPMAVLPGGTPYVVNGKATGAKAEFHGAQLNHYALRSLDGFLVKRARGRSCHINQVIGLNYWHRFERAGVPDFSINRYQKLLNVYLGFFFGDQTLRSLHDQGVEWHQNKAKELRALPEIEELIPKLIACTNRCLAPQSNPAKPANAEIATCAQPKKLPNNKLHHHREAAE